MRCVVATRILGKKNNSPVHTGQQPVDRVLKPKFNIKKNISIENIEIKLQN